MNHPESDGIELLGFEVISLSPEDSRGNVWVEATDGPTLLYGQNGVGKSHIIDGIRSVLSGSRHPSDVVTGRIFVRFDRHDLPWHIRQMLDDPRGSSRSSEFELFEDTWDEIGDSFQRVASLVDMRLPDLDGRGWDSDRFTFANLQTWEDYVAFQVITFYLAKEFAAPSPTDEIQSLLRKLAQEIVSDAIVCIAPAGTKDDPKWAWSLAVGVTEPTSAAAFLLDEAFGAFRKQCVDKGLVDDDLDLGAPAVQHGMNLVPIELWESGPVSSNLLFDDLMVISAIRGTAPVAPYAPCCVHQWPLYETTSLPFGYVDLDQLQRLDDQINDLVVKSKLDFFELLTLGDYFDSDGSQAEDAADDEADADHDEDDLLIVNADGSDETVVTDWRDPWFRLRTSKIRDLVEAVHRSEEAIESCGTSLGRCSFTLDTTASGYRDRRLVIPRFQDLRTPDKYVDYRALSEAQRRTIDVVVAIEVATSTVSDSGTSLIVVGDEVDSNLHRSAVVRLHRALATMPISSVIATHAFEALALPIGQRILVTRSFDGEISTQGFPIGDLLVASDRLGVEKEALLGLTRVFIVVARVFERKLLETLLEDRISGRLSALEVRVMSIGGDGNAVPVFDSTIFDYSDAHFLFVLDVPSVTTLHDRIDAGRRVSVERGLADGARKVMSMLSDGEPIEVAAVTESIAHAITSGALERVHICGMSESNIFEQFDPGDFGLDGDWNTLRSAYEEWIRTASQRTLPFETYLERVWNVPVSEVAANIAKGLDATPRSLMPVLDEVHRVLQLSRIS